MASVTHSRMITGPDADPGDATKAHVADWNAGHVVSIDYSDLTGTPVVPDPLHLDEYLSIGAAAAGTGAVRLSNGSLATYATGTLTVAVQPTAGDTFGGGVYTFVPTGTGANFGDIELGTNLAETQTNITQQYSEYWGPTVADIVFVSIVGDVITWRARALGPAGNAISTTTTFTDPGNFADAATLAGGADAVGGLWARNAADDADVLLSMMDANDRALLAWFEGGRSWFVDYTNNIGGTGSFTGMRGTSNRISLYMTGLDDLANAVDDFPSISFTLQSTAGNSSVDFTSEKATAAHQDIQSPKLLLQGSLWNVDHAEAAYGQLTAQPGEFGWPSYLSLSANNGTPVRIGANGLIMENTENGGGGIVGPNKGDDAYANWLNLNDDTFTLGETGHFVTIAGLPTADPMNGKAQLWVDTTGGLNIVKVGT